MKAIAVAMQHRAFPEGIGELRQVAHGIGVRWARVQATSRGSWGQGPLQQRSAAWSQGPNQQRNAAPLRLRRAVDTGPEAVEKISTTLRACGNTEVVPVTFSGAGCIKQRYPK